ncbi:MAG TPA: hypothetical protein VF616_04780, partial [Duganella sp.]
RHRRHATGAHALDWWLLLALGVVSVLAGMLATMRPALAALVLVLVIGVNALITGVLYLALALRCYERAPTPATADQPEAAAPAAPQGEPGEPGAAARDGIVAKEVMAAKPVVTERRVGERRMTPAGQH